MKIKQIKYILGIVLLLMLYMPTEVIAQQDPMYTQYMHNQLTVNPAYAGSTDMLSVMFLGRRQWVGFKGAPKTNTLSIHAPIKKHNLGLGFTLVNDKLGPLKQNSLYLDLSWHMRLKKGTLAMGLKAGFDMLQVNLMNLKLENQNDISFSQDYRDNFKLNFGLGFYYYTDKFYVGMSVPRMLKSYINDDSDSEGAYGFVAQHYFISSGYLFNLTDFVKLKPSVLLKVVADAPVSIDLSANFILYDKLWLGVNYRIKDSYGALIHYQVSDQIRVGYAYDLTNSELRRYNNGSHEIMIAYDFRFIKKKIMTPRYF